MFNKTKTGKEFPIATDIPDPPGAQAQNGGNGGVTMARGGSTPSVPAVQKNNPMREISSNNKG